MAIAYDRIDSQFEELKKILMDLKDSRTKCLTEVPRRDVAGFNGDKTQAELTNANGGNIHTTTFCYTPKSVKIAIPTFDGTNPRLWVKKCGRCFSLCNIQEDRKVEIASSCMIGKANKWMSDYLLIMKGADWTDVVLSLTSKFKDEIGLDVEKEFKEWEVSLKTDIDICDDEVLGSKIGIMDEECQDVLRYCLEPINLETDSRDEEFTEAFSSRESEIHHNQVKGVNEDRLSEFYQEHQSTVLNEFVKCGGCSLVVRISHVVATLVGYWISKLSPGGYLWNCSEYNFQFQNGWKVKPLPWRDKIEMVLEVDGSAISQVVSCAEPLSPCTSSCFVSLPISSGSYRW